MTALLQGPKTERTIALLTVPMRAETERLAAHLEVSIGDLVRSGLDHVLRAYDMPEPKEDAMAQPEASPDPEPRCGGCRHWGNQGRELQLPSDTTEAICRNRRSDFYETVTAAAGGCPSFRGA